jgi:hypothetical protein
MGLLYQRTMNFFNHFSLFRMKEFLNEIFFELDIKNTIDNVFCVNHC